MKNLSYYFGMILFLLFTFSNSVFAQDNTNQMRFSLYGGAALPQGDFSSTNGDKAGYAKTGFCVMIEGSKNIAESINWVSSVSLASNSLDESEMESKLSGISVSSGNYFTTWAMTGVGFETVASTSVKIYGAGQIGLLLSSFPDITLSSGGTSITQTTKMGTAFAYGFGVGMIINKINIGIRYYTGEPEYTEKASYGGISNTYKAKLPATVLQLLIGFNL
jgi:hypothetical protein